MVIKKQSFLAGSLTSSAAIFISKAIGLLYIVPFSNMAGGESNMIFYSAAYANYDLLLQICTAGIPFAIAALVAKYSSRDDYKTVILVRKLSNSILLLSGFIMAVIFIASSTFLAKSVLGESGSISDIKTLKNVFIILSLAIVLVPFLSSYRGFYQGLKEMKVYAVSQVIEQITRVVCLLLLGMFVVYILKLEGIWAIYMAVLSTSIAAIITIFYYLKFDKKNYYYILKMAKQQSLPAVDKKQIAAELFSYGLPYLIVAILGNSMSIVNNYFFMDAMNKINANYENSKILLGIIQVNTNKLTSIPKVLAIGFSAGIVPHLTSNLESRDFTSLKKNILLALDSVLYISLPLSSCLLLLATPIYFVMYGDRNLALGSDALVYSSFLALTTTISPICSSMMMTLKFRRKSIYYLFVGFLVKFISFYPLIKYFGYSGAIISSILTSIVIIFLNLQLISNKYNVNYLKTLIRFVKMIICVFAMNGSFVLLNMLGLKFIYNSRISVLLMLVVYGLIGMFTYYVSSLFLKLPTHILNIKPKGIFKHI